MKKWHEIKRINLWRGSRNCTLFDPIKMKMIPQETEILYKYEKTIPFEWQGDLKTTEYIAVLVWIIFWFRKFQSLTRHEGGEGVVVVV
jgi:hypothetical protein